ncbi:MAG: hypothetical protein Q9174_002129 [Haloplaca sp. 1 TL-2023]
MEYADQPFKVGVFVGGFIKVAYNHWKLRQYTAVENAQAAQRAEAGQAQPIVSRRGRVQEGNEVPFGIRAIESGIEVDGVWISRSNTPANSTPGTPAPNSPALSANPEPHVQPTAQSNRASTASNMSRLEIPQPAHGPRRVSPSSSTNTAHMRVSGNPFDRSLSSERIPSRPGSTLMEVPQARGRQTYQPHRSSGLRVLSDYQTEGNVGHSADALARLEGRQMESKTGSKSSSGSAEYQGAQGQRASNESWSGSSEEDHHAQAGQPSTSNRSSYGQGLPKPMKPGNYRYHSSDLDSLASHRKSHAAETGQLYPRVRVSDAAGEWTAVQQPAEHRNFLSQHSSSPMGSSIDPFGTPQSTPLMTPMHEPDRGAPSFEEFVRSNSPQGRYHSGEEGIPLQDQSSGNHGYSDYGHSDYGHSAVQYEARKQETAAGKASSFSEAV